VTDDLNVTGGSASLRALLMGPAFPPTNVGGLQLALDDLADQLRARGWRIDTSIYAAPAGNGEARRSPGTLQANALRSSLATFQRWPWYIRLWHIVPSSIRRSLSMIFMPRHFFSNASDNLYVIEAMLADARSHDVVLLCVQGTAPGTTALVAERHPRVVMISLDGLARELRANWWPWMRMLAHLRLGIKVHPFLFRRIAPHQIKLAVCASRQWQEEAVQAGLPETAARTIYFGIPLPEPLPRPTQAQGRLLWIGRLSPEKGLHLLLRALPSIRARVAEVSLTAIAGQGPPGYRRGILDMVRRYGLEDIVTFRPHVHRTALQQAYAEHDVLFLHSVNPEPVSLVLMEAYAAGIPVVASQARPEAKLVQDHVTCLCYQPHDTTSLVTAVVGMLTDAQLRDKLALNAQRLVRQEFSLDRMGQAYDELLRQWGRQAKNDEEDIPYGHDWHGAGHEITNHLRPSGRISHIGIGNRGLKAV
jgi:glycosyltransferase involved in cell wall biosynthesis